MIARAALTPDLVAWNARSGAPSHGAFALSQFAPTTRVWEYAWAATRVPLPRGIRTIDIGGGLGSFAIALAAEGADATVVDPNLDGKSPAAVRNAWARYCGVELGSGECTVDRLQAAEESFDLAFCLSVIEHLTAAERAQIMRGAHRLLRPGGFFVMTVDLFLGLAPFTATRRQGDAQNVSIPELIATAPFSLAQGAPGELFGFAEFDPAVILARARSGEFLVTPAGVMSQGMVLRRP